MSDCFKNFKNGLYVRRKKIIKTFSWRAIATTTTFSVALMLTGDASKAGAVAAVDTVLKTFLYYFHESCYDKATEKNWILCREDNGEIETDDDETEVENQKISIKISQI